MSDSSQEDVLLEHGKSLELQDGLVELEAQHLSLIKSQLTPILNVALFS